MNEDFDQVDQEDPIPLPKGFTPIKKSGSEIPLPKGFEPVKKKVSIADVGMAAKGGWVVGVSKAQSEELKPETPQQKLSRLGINVSFDKKPVTEYGGAEPVTDFLNKLSKEPEYIDLSNSYDVGKLSGMIDAKVASSRPKTAAFVSEEMLKRAKPDYSKKVEDKDDLMASISDVAVQNAYNKVSSSKNLTDVTRDDLIQVGLEYTKQVSPSQWNRNVSILNEGGDLGDENKYNLEKVGAAILLNKNDDQSASEHLQRLSQETEAAHPKFALAKAWEIVGAYNHEKDNKATGGWWRTRPSLLQVEAWLNEPELKSRFSGNEVGYDILKEQLSKLKPEQKVFKAEDVPISGGINRFEQSILSGVEDIGNIFRSDAERQISNLNPTIGRGTLSGNYRLPGEASPFVQRLNQLEDKQKDVALTEEEKLEYETLKKNSKIRSGWDKFKDQTSDVLGQVVLQALLTKGAGGVGKILTSAKTPMLLNSGISTALISYDQTRKDAVYNFPTDEVKQNIFTGAMTAANIFSERIFKDEKVFNAFRKGLEVDLVPTLKNLSAENISKQQIKNLVVDNAIKYGGRFVEETHKNAFEEAVVQASDEFLSATMNASDYDQSKALRNIADTYVTTLYSMGGVASLAAIKNKSRANELNSVVLYGAAQNPEKSLQYIKRLYETGEITKEDLIEKLEILNRASDIVLNEPERVSVKPTKQRSEYFIQTLNAELKREQLEAKKDKNEAAELKAQVEESEKKASDIYNELTPEQQLIKKAIDSGEISEDNMYLSDALTNPETANSLLETIASQAQGEVAPEFGDAKEAMVRQFGKTLVNEAIAKYPKLEKQNQDIVGEPEQISQPIELSIEIPESEKGFPKVEYGDAVETTNVGILEQKTKLTEQKDAEVKEAYKPSFQSVEFKKESSTAGTGTPPPGEGGVKVGVFSERPATELSFRGLQDVSNEFGYDDVRSRDSVTDVQERQNAINTANEWAEKGTYQKNIDELLSKIEARETVPTAKQRLILEQYLANESKKLRDIKDKPSAEFDTQLNKVKRIKDIGQIARQEAGAALRLPDGGSRPHPIEDYADAMVATMEANSVSVLTEAQKAEVEKLVTNYEQKSKEAEEKVAVMEQRLRDIEAAKEVGQIRKYKKAARKKTAEQLKEERGKILQSIKEKWASAGKDILSSDIPYRKQIAAIVPDVRRLVENLLDAGVNELSQIVDNIHAAITGDIPDIQKDDIKDIIAGKYSRKQKRSELAKKMADLKTEANLIDKLHELLRGEEPKSESKKIERNQKIQVLRNQIKDIAGFESELMETADEAISQKQKESRKLNKDLTKIEKENDAAEQKEEFRKLDEAEKEIKAEIAQAEKERKELEREFSKEKKGEKQAALKAKIAEQKELERKLSYKTPGERKLAEIKSRNEKETEKIREKIAKGDFEKEDKGISVFESKDLKQAYPREYKEMLDSISAKEQAKQDFDIAQYKAELAKRGKVKKSIDFVRSLIATTKAVKSGIDDSAVMMQNIVTMVSHPRSAVKALKEHALDALSEKRFRRYLTELHNSPIWDLIQKSELDITDPKSLNEQNKEEIFDNNLLNKDFKIKGKKYNIGKYATRPFERAFTSLGNAMRVNMFTRIAEREYEQGRTFETDPEFYKSLARQLNTETGRGKLHTQIQRASQLVTSGIWSPRLMASRINMLGLSELAPLYGGKGHYAGLHPEIRKMALMDMVKFLGAGASLMALAALQGAGVDDDPESPTFGTIQVGNKKYNAWGGFAPYAKTIYQGVTGHRKIGGERKEVTRSKLLGNFFRSRLTPAAGVTTNVMTGKDYSGKPVTLGGELMNLVAPLSITAVVDGVKKDGITGVLTQGLPSFVGVGVSDERDYDKSQSNTINLKYKNKKDEYINRDATIEENKKYEDEKVKETNRMLSEYEKGKKVTINRYGEVSLKSDSKGKEVDYNKLTETQQKELLSAIKESAGDYSKSKLLDEIK